MGMFNRKRVLPPPVVAVFACFSYAFCSTALTLANKAIFSEKALNYPWTLLAIQSLFSAFFLGLFYFVRDRRWPVKAPLLVELCRPCAVFAIYIFTNARALRYISLPLLSVLKSLAPMGIALVERILYNERLSAGTYGAMCLIILSNIVTMKNDVEFHFWGYVWATLNAVFNVLYVVFLRFYVTNKHSTGEKTLHNNILLSMIIVPTAFYAGEIPGFVQEFALTSVRFRVLFLLSCFLAVGIGASVFWVLAATSGSTLSFVGGANKVVVIVLGAILFEVHISPAGWTGVALGVAASVSFTLSKALSSRAAAKPDILLGSDNEKENGYDVHADSPASSPFAYSGKLSSRVTVRSTVSSGENKSPSAAHVISVR